MGDKAVKPSPIVSMKSMEGDDRKNLMAFLYFVIVLSPTLKKIGFLLILNSYCKFLLSNL